MEKSVYKYYRYGLVLMLSIVLLVSACSSEKSPRTSNTTSRIEEAIPPDSTQTNMNTMEIDEVADKNRDLDKGSSSMDKKPSGSS